MRVFITGGNGQLGRALRRALAGRQVYAAGRQDLDITLPNMVASTLDAIRPDIVIHAAAWTDTQGCERYPEKARLVNVEGARYVAEACAGIGADMLYVGSNEVFDGRTAEPYPEEAQPNPVNVYGQSKLDGERAVQQALERCWIVRTSWLYGAGRASFPEKILEAARKQGSLKVVTDEIASPTWTESLAEGIVRLITESAWGIHHLTNSGWCSRYEWAQAILEMAGLRDVHVEPVTLAEFGSVYQKPPFTALGNRRAADLGIALPHWREALQRYLASAQLS